MLMTYEPAWLKLGLESVFGTSIGTSVAPASTAPHQAAPALPTTRKFDFVSAAPGAATAPTTSAPATAPSATAARSRSVGALPRYRGRVMPLLRYKQAAIAKEAQLAARKKAAAQPVPLPVDANPQPQHQATVSTAPANAPVSAAALRPQPEGQPKQGVSASGHGGFRSRRTAAAASVGAPKHAASSLAAAGSNAAPANPEATLSQALKRFIGQVRSSF
jgi:hypothetical protein